LRADLDRLSNRQIGWLVFLVTLLVYWSLVPWVSRHWWLTGDQPHYLVVTHSLLTDRDLELSNNYQEKDFALFYIGNEIEPHVTIGPDGGAYPAHTVGLSVLLLPAYALGYLVLGSHAGVLYFLTTTGALLAANVYLLCYEVTDRKLSSLLAWVTTAFTVPVMHYSFQVYPEILGALLLVWSLRHIRRGRQTKPHIWLMVGVCVGFLPWLVTRFALLSVVLGPAALLSIAFAQGTRRWHSLSMLALCLPLILSCGALVAFDLHFYGHITPTFGYWGASQAIPGYVLSPSPKKSATALMGSLFDQDFGLVIYTPIYALSFLGMLLILRSRRYDGLLLSLPVVTTYLGVIWIGFTSAWDIPYRFLVVILPLAGVAVAYSLQKVTSPVFRAFGLVLFLIALTRTPLLFQEPLVAHTLDMQAEPSSWTAYARLIPLSVRQYIPSLRQRVTASHAYSMADDEVGQVVNDPQADGQCGVLASTQMVVRAQRGVDEMGYILDTLWPDSEQLARLLPAGEYSACFRMKSEQGLPAETVVAMIDVSTEGGILAQNEVARGDLPDSGYGASCISFHYPGAERLRLRVLFTGQADLWLSCLTVSYADNARWWVLSGFWLAALGSFVAYYYVRHDSKCDHVAGGASATLVTLGSQRSNTIFRATGAVLVVLIFGALGAYIYSLVSPRTFEAEGLRRLTGEVVADPEASGGKAAYASRDMQKNALVYGPYEFFRPGEYEVVFRMKRGTALAGAEVAAIDVYGSASGVLAMQSLMSDDFEDAGRYQEFRLSFSNPASQALEFRVHFLGAADLWVDKIVAENVFGQGFAEKG
jgi:hypothetical protein